MRVLHAGRLRPYSGERRGGRATTRGRAVLVSTLVVLTASLPVVARARAAPGDLDPTFSGDGKVTTDFGGGGDYGADVAVQADGKIVVVGGTGSDFALAGYDADGSLDSSFDGDGRQTTEFAGGAAYGVALQPDGKIVVVGGSTGGFAVARYDADGSLDPSFDADGKQITAIPVNSDDSLSDVAIQPDGWLVVVGTSSEPNICGCTDLVVGHYTPDGSPAGLPFTSVTGTDSGGGVALQPDGKIVAVGQALAAGGTAGDFALARYEGGSVSGTAPVNATPPTISGTATESQALTASPGTWTDSNPITRDYQWRRCDSVGANCLDIAAASATIYTLVAADVGHTIRVRETATSAYGQTSVASVPTAVVTAKPKPGAIAGTVRNAKTGAGITNAAVDCGSGYSTTTASKYSIPNVPPGGYACTASASGYRSSTQSVTVSAGQTTTANFNLARQ